jgi:hypothetical protein
MSRNTIRHAWVTCGDSQASGRVAEPAAGFDRIGGQMTTWTLVAALWSGALPLKEMSVDLSLP